MIDLRVICIDADAPPLFTKSVNGVRRGYEPDLAALVAGVLSRRLEWVMRPWGAMIPALDAGEGDAIWCGQGITPHRRALVDFTRPYAVFDESVIVRSTSAITSAGELRGRRVGAIADSTNMALAQTFEGAVTVAFDGSSADVFGEMIGALCAGAIDAVVDDDVALVPLVGDDDLAIAFTVATRNAWGVAVAKDRPEVRSELDSALARIIADGRLQATWRRWMGSLAFPLAPAVGGL